MWSGSAGHGAFARIVIGFLKISRYLIKILCEELKNCIGSTTSSD